MERSRLSIRALVVLASELGAEHLFGVLRPVYDDGSRGNPGGV